MLADIVTAHSTTVCRVQVTDNSSLVVELTRFRRKEEGLQVGKKVNLKAGKKVYRLWKKVYLL